MKREADVIKKNEKGANEYLTQTLFTASFHFPPFCAILIVTERGNFMNRKTILVTGSSRGIGKAIAIKYAKKG